MKKNIVLLPTLLVVTVAVAAAAAMLVQVWLPAAILPDVFLETEFEGGRHQRRIDQIMEIENS